MDCLFCKIAEGIIPSDKVYEDDTLIAFRDINPQAPQHFLIVPRKHIANVAELQVADNELVAHIFVDVVPLLAKKFGVAEKGFRVVINTGEDGGQTVNHLHIHLIGGRKMTWPPG